MMPTPTTDEATTRQALLDKLALSREEIRSILDPPPRGESDRGEATQPDPFPRSRTMRALLSSHGIGAAGALAGGLLIARPALALRLLRLVPVSTVGKMLIAKAISGLRSNKGER
jgi:hypothetical protein